MLFPICRFSSLQVSSGSFSLFSPAHAASISQQPPRALWQQQRERTFLLQSTPGVSVPDPWLGEPGRRGSSVEGLPEMSQIRHCLSHHASLRSLICFRGVGCRCSQLISKASLGSGWPAHGNSRLMCFTHPSLATQRCATATPCPG